MYLLLPRATWLVDRGMGSLDDLLPGQRSSDLLHRKFLYHTWVLAHPLPLAGCDLLLDDTPLPVPGTLQLHSPTLHSPHTVLISSTVLAA